MTKIRAPLTFSHAIAVVAGLIGYDAAARVTGRARRTVRHWGDSDKKTTPTLAQAIALDQAYMTAGGDYPPILSSYAYQLDVAMAEALGCRLALAKDIAAVSRETGEAIAWCIQAIQPDATPAMIHRAIMETEEAGPLFPRILGHLKSLLPGNGAGQVKRGTQSEEVSGSRGQ